MVEVAFHSCLHVHEKWFVEGKRKKVRECVASCVLRKEWLNPLCAHPTVWNVRERSSAMALIIAEVNEKSSEAADLLYAYKNLIKFLDDISYFLNTDDYCRVTSWTISWDILLSIKQWDRYKTLDMMLDLCAKEIQEITLIVTSTKFWRIKLNKGQKNRILHLIGSIQDRIEYWIRKICLENSVELVDVESRKVA